VIIAVKDLKRFFIDSWRIITSGKIKFPRKKVE
jgi:hypothetical protein